MYRTRTAQKIMILILVLDMEAEDPTRQTYLELIREMTMCDKDAESIVTANSDVKTLL